jgi:indole-3-acetate monooxygenase
VNVTIVMERTEWLEVAREFAPRIEAARAEAERERRFPHELIRDMARAGLFRLKLPCKYGGVELDHVSHFKLIEEVSMTNASAGWLIMIGNENASSAGYLPEAGADEVFGSDPDVILAVALKSRHANVHAVDGGYTVTGQWALASGCVEAAWLGVAAVIQTENGLRLGPDGRPELHALLLPRKACSIVENWDALGLRATTSHDIAMSNAFVPEHRAFAISKHSELPGALWRGPLRTHLGAIGAVALGVARAAIDELVSIAGQKVPLFSRTSLRERASAQARVAEAEALVRSARAFLYEVLADMWRTQSTGQHPSEAQLVVRELAVVNAVQASARAVSLMYDTAGSDAVYATSKLQVCFRDIHVITQHFAGSTNRYEQLGQHFLGPPSSTR